MPHLTLEAMKARHGDALFLEFDGTRVMIDGGASGVYNSVLKDRLDQMQTASGGPGTIHLLIVSHIDDDHVKGLLDLTDELVEQQTDGDPERVRVRHAWHNSFSDMVLVPGGAVSPAGLETAGNAASSLLSAVNLDDSSLVAASVAQGRRFSNDLSTLSIPQNAHFGGDLSVVGDGTQPWTRNGLKLTLIGPGQEELKDLQDEWKKQLPKILKKEALAVADLATLDKSISNLASLVIIAQAGSKRVLLTGDARGDKVLDWLKKAEGDKPVYHFDIVKMPHHGSRRSNTDDFLQHVTADKYVFSGNGNHANPHPDTLQKLLLHQPHGNYELVFTYGPQEMQSQADFLATDFDNAINALVAAGAQVHFRPNTASSIVTTA